MKKLLHSTLIPVLISSLVVVGSGAFSPSRATDLGRRSRPRPPRHGAEFKNCGVGEQRHTSATALCMIQGGAILPVSKTAVAKVCTGYLAFRGASLLVSPMQFVKMRYKLDVEQDSLETYLLKAIGAISIGMSVNVYLSLVENMSAQKAMGFALLPRFLYVLKSSLVGKELERLGGSNKFLSTNEIVMAWSTFSLLTGAGNPMVSAKVFSCMALLKGGFFVANPIGAARKFLGLDVSKAGTEKSRALCRGLGNELTTSALLMGALAFGVSPFKAAGYTCLLWMVLLADMAFRDRTYELVGDSSPRSPIGNMFLAAVFAFGFLAYPVQNIRGAVTAFYKGWPLVAAFATTSIKACLADSVAQYRDVCTTVFSKRRNLAMALYSGTTLGVCAEIMYNRIFPLMFGTTESTAWVVKMTLFDGFVNAPLIYLPPAYLAQAIVYRYPMRKALQKYANDVKENGLLKKYWSLWVPVTFLNFSVVPAHYRIAFAAGVSFFWMIILSLVANKSDQDSESCPVETEPRLLNPRVPD